MRYVWVAIACAATVLAGFVSADVGASNATDSKLIFLSDFESGAIKGVHSNPDGWQVKAIRDDHAVVQSEVVRAGKYALKFVLQHGLDYSSVNGNGQDKPRVDLLKWPFGFDYRSDYYVGFSVHVPKDWKDDHADNAETIFQLKQRTGGSPMIALIIRGKNWRWVNRRDASSLTWRDSTSTQTTFFEEPLANAKGQWVDFVLRFRLCAESGCDGIVQLWRNGTKVADFKGANAYVQDPEQGPYPEIDLYKHSWYLKPTVVSERVLYFDEFRVGRSYDEVAPPQAGAGPAAVPPGDVEPPRGPPPKRPGSPTGLRKL